MAHTVNCNKNGWNKQTVQILREKCDGEFIFKGNLLCILPNTAELSHEWVLTNFKYQEQSNAYLQLK